MIIAEFSVDHPVLREPLGRVPGVEVTWEQTAAHLGGPTQMVAWVDCDDFDRFDAAVADDPGTTNPVVLSRADDRRLYRFDFTERGRETNPLPTIGEVGGVLQQAVGTGDGWRCRVRLPDREALETVYHFCRDHDLDFTFHRLFDRTDWVGGGPRLTDAQRELLLEAADSGYLAIPRETSLAELAARLGISETAASERFRRGVRNLVEQTVPEEWEPR